MYWLATSSPEKELSGGLALGGFLYLLLPGADVPPLISASLMIISGISWAIYTLIGQKSTDPICATSQNFVWTLPVVIPLLSFMPLHLNSMGLFWGILSGVFTSAMAYSLWYILLRKMITSTAAIIQLSVPALAALGGVVFLSEPISVRLIVASVFIFAGIIIKIKSAPTTHSPTVSKGAR